MSQKKRTSQKHGLNLNLNRGQEAREDEDERPRPMDAAAYGRSLHTGRVKRCLSLEEMDEDVERWGMGDRGDE